MEGIRKLRQSFYLRTDVVKIAKELLGKVLVTNFGNEKTTGRIVETEAYAGEIDKASHAFRGKTKRTGIMYGEGCVAYVYLCYGIHQMFNIVTADSNTPHAILIRGISPVAIINPKTMRSPLVPVMRTMFKAIRLCRFHFSIASPIINPPRNKKITGLAYEEAVASIVLMLNNGNNTNGSNAVTAMGNASETQSAMISAATAITLLAPPESSKGLTA